MQILQVKETIFLSLEEEFVPLIADVQLHFCLATVDPDGQPTSGITFTHTDVKDIALQTGEGGRMAIHYDQLGGRRDGILRAISISG